MVKPELIEFKPHRVPVAVAQEISSTDVLRLERAPSGAWFVVADLTFEFYLKDLRKITINKQVRLRGQQTGMKPYGGFKRKKA